MWISQKKWDVIAESLSQALTERDKALELLYDIDVQLGKKGWVKNSPECDALHNRMHKVLLEREEKK